MKTRIGKEDNGCLGKLVQDRMVGDLRKFVFGKIADHQACVLQEGKKKRDLHWSREHKDPWYAQRVRPPSPRVLPSPLAWSQSGLEEDKVRFIAAQPRKSEQTSMLKAGSSGSALPTLLASVRPQDPWGSKLILSSRKNQTLGLVTNPWWNQKADGTMSASYLPVVFTADYLAFLCLVFLTKRIEPLVAMISFHVKNFLKREVFNKPKTLRQALYTWN